MFGYQMKLIAETYVDLLKSPAHWMFEFTIEGITGLVGYLIGRKVWRRKIHDHDVTVHGIPCDDITGTHSHDR